MRPKISGIGLAVLAALVGCASSQPNRDPVGERFPSVTGEPLDGGERRLPEDFEGQKVLLLVGYVQETQFDLDRWLLGLAQQQVPVEVREIPTIEGLVPGLFAGAIDEGMRGGIPEEDWSSVITVYADADRIVDLTGNENPNNARVILLDENGRIIWFHDRGYSPRLVLVLDRLVRGGADVAVREPR